ncbi:MAG: hypothetical protein MUE44_27870 [Oscillatoriaceae cyanobacterium Prado104]|nr:hypothetical protein [Oscillatoriaceae cyanobacterium Prado104]
MKDAGEVGRAIGRCQSGGAQAGGGDRNTPEDDRFGCRCGRQQRGGNK